jgi:hypothetical protein
VFHVELKQFPGVARAFNLNADELQRRFVGPWLAGQVVELDDRRYAPDRARIVIYEGPELSTAEMGMGRGWANVMRAGSNVTARMLRADPAVEQLKQAIEGRLPLSIPAIVALASEQWPGRRASERLALAELAVWELLHQRRARLTDHGQPVEPAQWEPLVLAWETWSAPRGSALRLER